MGIYLSVPSSDVAVESFVGPGIKVGVGEMQGWRKNMEDAHIVETSLAPQGVVVGEAIPTIALFGVFDGHGGKEVAKFTKLKYAEELVKLPAFKNGDYATALVNSFHRIDEMLEDKVSK